MKEKVSIVVAIYNAESSLAPCVDSILGQSYKNLEIILVDDGSSDNSPGICDEFCEKDSRVICIHKENGGLTSARKEGYEKSTGEYIAFFDSDDYLEPDYIEKQRANIQTTDSDVSVCTYFYETETGQKEAAQYDFSKTVFLKEDYVKELILPRVFRKSEDTTCIPDFMWLRLFKRSLITENCFVSEREVYTEDIFFNLEYLRNCRKVSVLDLPLYHYIVHESSLTHRHRKNRCNMEIARLKLLKQYLLKYDAWDKDRFGTATFRAIWGCIDNSFYTGRFRAFKEELSEARNNPELQQMMEGINPQCLASKDRLILKAFRGKRYFLLYAYKKLRK